MSKRFVALVFTLVSVALLGSAALGHEERNVGPISITVGWAEEPAIAGLRNAVQVHLSRSEAPVTEDVTLRAEVRFEDDRFGPVDLSPVRETPGEFRAPLIPTTPGAYVFTITGKVGDTEVDQEFEPGTETFAEVEGPSTLQFPEKAPTSAEAGRAIARLQGDLDRARDSATSAGTQAKIGIGIGFLGLIAAGISLGSRRRKEAV